MTERFFTNAVPAAGPLIGTERIPADLVAGGSVFLTPGGLEVFVEPTVVAAALAAWRAARGATQQYSSDPSTAGFAITTGQVVVAGAGIESPVLAVLDLTGALVAAASVTMPTAAALIAAVPHAFAGQTYRLRIINNSSGAFAWTVLGNTGLTVTGTATVAQSTWREFLVTLVGAGTVTLQNTGSGGN